MSIASYKMLKREHSECLKLCYFKNRGYEESGHIYLKHNRRPDRSTWSAESWSFRASWVKRQICETDRHIEKVYEGLKWDSKAVIDEFNVTKTALVIGKSSLWHEQI